MADQLRVSGRVIRGRIGVEIDQVTKEVAESIGLGKPMGALVRSVESGGPAEKAGVEAGDIITKVDGKAIEKAGDLPRIIGGTKPGSEGDAAGVPPRRLPRPRRHGGRVRGRAAAPHQRAQRGHSRRRRPRRPSAWRSPT